MWKEVDIPLVSDVISHNDQRNLFHSIPRTVGVLGIGSDYLCKEGEGHCKKYYLQYQNSQVPTKPFRHINHIVFVERTNKSKSK